MLCHPEIHPGSMRRQRWRVPQSLQTEGMPKRLHDSSPSHVFVVAESDCFVWDERVDLHMDLKDDPAASIMLPSNVDSL